MSYQMLTIPSPSAKILINRGVSEIIVLAANIAACLRDGIKSQSLFTLSLTALIYAIKSLASLVECLLR